MNNGKKILKDIEYYKETIEAVRETDEYLEFKSEYKEHKIQKNEKSIEDAYVAKVGYELFRAFDNNLNSSSTTFIKDREILANVGKFLDTLEILREKLNLNNSTISKKDPLFKYKVNNPFFVSYEQIKKEFDITENKKNGECEVCSKNMFWINKTIKTVRGLRFGRQMDYAKQNRLNSKVFRHILYTTYHAKEVRNVETNIMEDFYGYLNNIITYDEFKKNENFQKLKNYINKSMKDNASIKGKIPEIDVNFLMHDLTLSNLLTRLYLGKIYYMEKAIRKIDDEGIIRRNKIKVGTVKYKNKSSICIILPKYNIPFEIKIDRVYINRDLDKLNLDFIDKEVEKLPCRKNIIYKFTKEQCEKLSEVTESYSILNKPAKKLIDFSNLMCKGKTKEVLTYYEKTKVER